MNTTGRTNSIGDTFGKLRALVGTFLAVVGVLTTTIFAIVLLGCIAGRIQGRADSGIIHFLFVWLAFGALPLAGAVAALPREAAARRFCRRMLLGMLLVSSVASLDAVGGPANWHGILGTEISPASKVADLHRTIVSAHLECPINSGTNVLWCGTFQLAWNEVCQLTGGDLVFDRPQPMAAILNKHVFATNFLDDASFVALAGFVRENILVKIQAAVEQKFHGAFQPELIPNGALTPRPQDIVAYACLYKKLDFSNPFERLAEPLTFDNVLVTAFGLGPYKASLGTIYPQVRILDYQNENDFVIELKSKSSGDRLILAKIQPGHDLQQTVSGVESRIASKHEEQAATNDLLAVPKLNFDLQREYSEIEGLRLIPRSAKVAKDLVLLSAVQSTKFEMNEEGVKLQSESSMEFGCAKQMEPVPAHRMIFDRPFLILMQRTNSLPYFALWVSNPEILAFSK